MTSKKDIKELANNWIEAFQADKEVVKDAFSLMRLILESKQPLSASQIADMLQISENKAAAMLNRMRPYGAEFNEEGKLVGYGLTLVPTPHRYTANEHTFYGWCAPDTIFFPPFFRHTALIESPDPISGNKISLTISDKGIEKVEPSTSVVSSRFKGAVFSNVRGSVCYYGHFFESFDTASKYASIQKSAEVEVLSPEEFFRIGKILLEEEPLKSILGSIN